MRKTEIPAIRTVVEVQPVGGGVHGLAASGAGCARLEEGETSGAGTLVGGGVPAVFPLTAHLTPSRYSAILEIVNSSPQE